MFKSENLNCGLSRTSQGTNLNKRHFMNVTSLKKLSG